MTLAFHSWKVPFLSIVRLEKGLKPGILVSEEDIIDIEGCGAVSCEGLVRRCWMDDDEESRLATVVESEAFEASVSSASVSMESGSSTMSIQ